MQLSEAYTYTPLVTTLTALHPLQIHACTQISHIREKQEHFKVLFFYFRYEEKKLDNSCSVCNVLCKPLEKGPQGREKSSFTEPHTHSTPKGI